MKTHRYFGFASHSPVSPLARLSRRLLARATAGQSPAPAAARPPVAAFESLESRTLMSASHALAGLRADAREVKAEFVALSKVDAANLKVIAADLKAAGLSKADKAEFKTLAKGDAAALKVLKNDIKHVLGVIGREANSLDSDGSKLLKAAAAKGAHGKGTSKLATRVKTEITKLSTDSATGLTGLTNDATAVTTTDATDSSALVKANPSDTKLKTDVTTAQADLLSAEQALDVIVAKVLTTDVNSLIGLYSDIPITS